MKAIQFLAEKGIEEAKRVLEGAPDFPVFGYCVLTGSYIFERKHANAYYHNETNSWSEDYALELIILKELKQVVESVEIVQRSGGFESVKAAITNYRASGDMVTFSSLEKRLADCELVESYKDSKND